MSIALRQSQTSLPNMSNDTSISSPMSQKRKRDVGPKFYAVKVGHKPGIYHNWDDCIAQVKGVKNATFKSFPSLSEAEFFLKNGLSLSKETNSSKFYGVQSGRIPGVYTDWDAAKVQVYGWTKPKYKAFPTRAEAEAFVREGANTNGSTMRDEDDLAADSPTTAKSKGPPAKKQKKTANISISPDGDVDDIVEPGTGPLPPGSEDGFDSRLILNPATGTIEYKTEQQRNATRMQAIGPADGSMLRIYTDGSTLGNGGEAAVAGVGVYFGPQDPRNISERLHGSRQTNQRAELTAVQRALEAAPRDHDVTIFSDSNYAIKCVTIWFQNWRDNGWKNSTKEDVKNRDLVEAVVSRIEERERLGSVTKFEWIKGHANNPGNIAADHLAVNGARMAQQNLV